ncbi:MAG: phosphatase PAP2 family protein [Rhizobiaceae bacterium]
MTSLVDISCPDATATARTVATSYLSRCQSASSCRSRGAADFTIALDRVEGILNFPSVHAGIAVLCVWATAGSRLLFWPFVVLNTAIACAAITHGSHYLVDIVAGFVVAAACIALTQRLFPGCGIKEARIAARALFEGLRNSGPWARPAVPADIAPVQHS